MVSLTVPSFLSFGPKRRRRYTLFLYLRPPLKLPLPFCHPMSDSVALQPSLIGANPLSSTSTRIPSLLPVELWSQIVKEVPRENLPYVHAASRTFRAVSESFSGGLVDRGGETRGRKEQGRSVELDEKLTRLFLFFPSFPSSQITPPLLFKERSVSSVMEVLSLILKSMSSPELAELVGSVPFSHVPLSLSPKARCLAILPSFSTLGSFKSRSSPTAPGIHQGTGLRFYRHGDLSPPKARDTRARQARGVLQHPPRRWS